MINIKLSMNNIVSDKDKLYFLAFSSNSIIEMNKDMSKCRIIARIPRDERVLYNEKLPLYEGIYLYQNKFFILPDLAERIVVYDRGRNDLRYIAYPDSKNKYTPFFRGVMHDNYLYIIPCTHNRIFRLNMLNEEISEVGANGICIHSGENVCAWGAVAELRDGIAFTSMEQKKIFWLRYEDETIEDMTPVGMNEELSGILYYKERYWVIPKTTNRLIVLDNNFKIVSEKRIDVDNYKSSDWSFMKMQVIGSCIYFLPRRANMFLKFNISEEVFEPIDTNLSIDEENRLDKFMPISNVWENNGQVFFAHSSSGRIFRVDQNETVECKMIIDNAYNNSYDNTIVYENDEIDNLNEFIKSLIFVREVI